jgi:hypothetical protein
MAKTSTRLRGIAAVIPYTRCRLLWLPLLLAVLVCPARSGDDTLFHVYSRATPQSVVSRSFAGAGSAMPHDVFQGLVNPALTTADIGPRGAVEAGYGRDDVFDRLALPFGAVLFDNGGVLGGFYRYLSGERGEVHDAAVNIAGRLFERTAPEEMGPVDFGLNVRYESSKRRHDIPAIVADGGDGESESVINTVTARSDCVILDIGFYQQYFPGIDVSLVFSNLLGYRWSEADGRGKSEGGIDGRHRLITVGMLYTLPISGTFLLRIPVDVEIANVFVKSASTAYMFRAGAELRIAKMYSVRFGYARAPEDPVELVKTFDYDNLFFGGAGVAVKSFLLDVFVGKREFGMTVTYGY